MKANTGINDIVKIEKHKNAALMLQARIMTAPMTFPSILARFPVKSAYIACPEALYSSDTFVFI